MMQVTPTIMQDTLWITENCCHILDQIKNHLIPDPATNKKTSTIQANETTTSELKTHSKKTFDKKLEIIAPPSNQPTTPQVNHLPKDLQSPPVKKQKKKKKSDKKRRTGTPTMTKKTKQELQILQLLLNGHLAPRTNQLRSERLKDQNRPQQQQCQPKVDQLRSERIKDRNRNQHFLLIWHARPQLRTISSRKLISDHTTSIICQQHHTNSMLNRKLISRNSYLQIF